MNAKVEVRIERRAEMRVNTRGEMHNNKYNGDEKRYDSNDEFLDPSY